MDLFYKKTNIDFMGIKKLTAILSILMIVVSFGFIFIKGLNWGIDFTGGYQIQVTYQKAPDISKVKQALDVAGLQGSEVITFGRARDIMIRLMPSSHADLQAQQNITADGSTAQQALQSKVQSALGDDAKISSINYIGPQVGQELATNGLLAMVVALICIMGYIAFRFEMKFALSAGIALLHDPIIILGVFAAFGLEFNLTSLAAILAVIGYSLNDTVVIYDRIRENFRKMRKTTVHEIINRSVNDTLSRTIITSVLTLIVCVVLFFFGGPSIHEFSLALILGIIVGTYSSVYIAGALAVVLGLKREDLLAPAPIKDATP